MKLKILILPNNTYPTSHTFLKEVYSNILQNKGHEISWVMQSSKKLKKNKSVSWNGTMVHVTIASPGTSHFDKLKNYIFYYIGKACAFQNIIKNEKIDIVQVRHGIFEGLLAVYAKKKKGIPFSFQYTFPDPEADVYFAKSKMVAYPHFSYIHGVISKPILILIMAMADLVLPVSKQMKHDLVKEGILEKRMMIFPMCVNTNRILKEKSVISIQEKFKLSHSSTLIYVGTMDKSRELDFLLKVILKMKEEIHNIRCMMIGTGNDITNLRDLCLSLCLQNNVIFTGQVPHSRIPEFIASANIGVSPIPPIPIYAVGSATKTVEYLAMGKPVVGNDIADQKEVINNSGGGFLVKYDVQEFTDAIIWLLEHPEKAKEMGEKGREWIRENRSYEQFVTELEKRYHKIVGRN